MSIHRSVKALKQATLEISDGSFEHQPNLSDDEEFAQLAKDFISMGRKLRELEQLRLDASPLTGFVITSYSIHYTKLYDERLASMVAKPEKVAQMIAEMRKIFSG